MMGIVTAESNDYFVKALDVAKKNDKLITTELLAPKNVSIDLLPVVMHVKLQRLTGYSLLENGFPKV
jgi:hypothetical protein